MPHRLLQAMPSKWKRGYLLRQSGGKDEGGLLNLCKKLQNTKRLILAWPHAPEEVLIAVPAVKSLLQSLGPSGTCMHLAEATQAPLLAGLFPSQPLVAWDRQSLAWHEPAVQTGLASLRAFNPDGALSLLDPFPPVLQALVRASGAELRVAVDAAALWPYANVRLESDPESPLPSRYFQALALWRYAGLPAQERWMRMQPGPAQRQAAAGKWAQAGARPEDTWLYLQDPSARGPDPDARALADRIREKEPGEFSLGLLSFQSGGAAARAASWNAGPRLQAASWGELLGLLDSARGVAACNGPALHFASLAEVPCLALLRRQESSFDVSRWNPMFRVAWI